MVGNLHLKSSMHKVEVFGASDVHRRPELAVNKALIDAHVLGILRRVREDDLRSLSSALVERLEC